MSGRGEHFGIGRRKASERDEDDDDDEEPRNAYDSYGDYFRQKSRKLNEQAPTAADGIEQIFAGIAVYVDGYTEPSALSPWSDAALACA